MKSSVVHLLILVTSAHCVKFPSNFKKCYRKDPSWNECILEAARDGISQLTKTYPEINLANFAPLDVTELRIGAGSEAVVNVDQNFKNCKMYGINEMKLETYDLNLEKKYQHLTGVIPQAEMKCEYELNGKLLLLPIVGTGQSTIVLKNTKFSAHFDFEEVKKKDKTYANFITQKLELDPELISFNFENLFNGDKLLGDNINKVLNENYKEVFADVKQGYEDGLGKIFQQVFNDLFSKVSIEEAAD